MSRHDKTIKNCTVILLQYVGYNNKSSHSLVNSKKKSEGNWKNLKKNEEVNVSERDRKKMAKTWKSETTTRYYTGRSKNIYSEYVRKNCRKYLYDLRDKRPLPF